MKDKKKEQALLKAREQEKNLLKKYECICISNGKTGCAICCWKGWFTKPDIIRWDVSGFGSAQLKKEVKKEKNKKKKKRRKNNNLTSKKVREIKEAYRNGTKKATLAKKYEVSIGTIRNILDRVYWKDVW